MDVSVIIVNYNTKTLTDDCISSIVRETTGIKYEIILIDNNSSDGSNDYFRMDNRVRFIQSGANIGFGRANNIGFQHAEGKYLFLLNSDTILRNNAIKIFYDRMEALPTDIAGIGCLLKNHKNEICHSYATFPSIHEIVKIPFAFLSSSNNNLPKSETYVDYITGADLFLRSECVSEHGGFDPDFFMYFEETELEWRYTKKGFRFYIIDGPDIVHLEGKSTGGVTNRKSSFWMMYFRSMFLFMGKRYTFTKYLLFRICVIGCLPLIIKNKYSIKDSFSIIKLFFSPLQ